MHPRLLAASPRERSPWGEPSWPSGPATCTDPCETFKTVLRTGPPPPRPGRRKRDKGLGRVNGQGYFYVRIVGRDVALHRLIMEHRLGRRLAVSEHVHHRDGNRLNNTPENLAVLSAGIHSALHNARRPLLLYCAHCGEPFRPGHSRVRCCSRQCGARHREGWPAPPPGKLRLAGWAPP